MTEVPSETELLDVLGSGSLAETETVLVIFPALVGVTVIVALALEKREIEAILQVTVPLAWLQLPCGELAEKKVTPAGSVSVSVMPVAFDGPLLTTEME